MRISKTVVISCAGMGSRLGLNKTKALINIEGKTLIQRQLEMLENVSDIRVVIGYQHEQVIEEVLKHRKDVVFVFNHNYRETGTGASFSMACEHANEYVISLDGDLIIHPEDMNHILNMEGEFICGYNPNTEDPVYLNVHEIGSDTYVNGFSRKSGKYEWSGLVQIKKDKVRYNAGHVYYIIEPLLPMRFKLIRAKEIDTVKDYKNAVNWIKNNYRED